jgi:hypothetical protein
MLLLAGGVVLVLDQSRGEALNWWGCSQCC